MHEQTDEQKLAAFIAGRSDPVRYPLGPFCGEYNEDGVDLSLLRHMLSLSPLERLQVMEQHARDTLILYEYGRKHREAEAAKVR